MGPSKRKSSGKDGKGKFAKLAAAPNPDMPHIVEVIDWFLG